MFIIIFVFMHTHTYIHYIYEKWFKVFNICISNLFNFNKYWNLPSLWFWCFKSCNRKMSSSISSSYWWRVKNEMVLWKTKKLWFDSKCFFFYMYLTLKYKPFVCIVSNGIIALQPDHKEMSWNVPVGCFELRQMDKLN